MAASAVITQPYYLDEIDDLQIEADKLYAEIAPIAIDWRAIKWDKAGPSALFEQFRIAGGWADHIISRELALEHKRNRIINDFSNSRISIERRLEGALKTGSKQLITQGYAYQERIALARIEVGDAVWNQTVFDRRMDSLNSTLALIRAKAKQFTDFKVDARTAVSMLNFGHSIGELL